LSMYFATWEDAAAYTTYPRFYAYNNAYSGYDQATEFSPQYYRMRSSPMKMMAPQFAPVPLRWDPRASSIS